MYKAQFLIFFVFIFCSCKSQQKNNNCAYSLRIIYNHADEVSTPFFLYRDRLIELVLKEKNNVEISLKDHTEKQSTTYDTTALQIIDLASKKFVQIDSFRQTFKILKKGNYKDSPIGLKGIGGVASKDSLSKNDIQVYYASLKDTSINGQFFKFGTSTIKNSLGKDSILTTHYYIQRKGGLLSLFNQNGVNNPSNEISIAGFTVYFYKQNYSLTMRIENVRALTKREQLICESIYHKTKQ